jgi:hypothetical protein
LRPAGGRLSCELDLGKDKYPFAQPGDVRLLVEIEPASVSVMG